MWLLSTARAEIHEFKIPEDIPPYAILSHIIDDQELESLEQLVALRKLCATGSELPRNLVSEMISDSCKLALDNKHEWIWIYPCCVDERNETKRDNDIADMFSFYEKSAVCYAYLDNVVEERPLGYYNRPFMGSPWFKDCRTVQALVAPKQVVFVSRLWKILGNKRQCAAELATELSIPMDLLLLRTNVQDYSVSQRMSWASERERVPAKPEDSIYSLLGLFGVRMRLRYEGVGQAFYCLQREIMKTSPDTSLFVWGEEASTIDVLSGKSVAVTPYDSCPVHSDHSAYLLAPALLHFQSLPGSYSTFISAKSNSSVRSLCCTRGAISTDALSPRFGCLGLTHSETSFRPRRLASRPRRHIWRLPTSR